MNVTKANSLLVIGTNGKTYVRFSSYCPESKPYMVADSWNANTKRYFATQQEAVTYAKSTVGTVKQINKFIEKTGKVLETVKF